MTQSSYATHPLAEELRWLLGRDFEGDLGKRSTAGPQLDRIAQGALVQTGGRDTEPDDRVLAVARKLAVVESAFRRLPIEHRATLVSAFAPRSLRHLDGLDTEYALEGLQPRMDTAESRVVVGLIVDGPALAKAHAGSGSKLSPIDWLRHAEKVVRKKRGRACLERAQLERLVADAHARMEVALAAYADERRQGASVRRSVKVEMPERGPRVRRWFTMQEVAAALGVSRRTAAKRAFATTRRCGRGRTAAVEVADHCVRAAVEERDCECAAAAA